MFHQLNLMLDGDFNQSNKTPVVNKNNKNEVIYDSWGTVTVDVTVSVFCLPAERQPLWARVQALGGGGAEGPVGRGGGSLTSCPLCPACTI